MDELLSQIDPEVLRQLLEMGTLDERGDALQQQLLQAQELRKPISGQHSTGFGAAMGGLGDVFRGITSQMEEAQTRKQMDDLMNKKDAGRNAYVDALRNGRGKSSTPGNAGMGDMLPSLLSMLG